MQPPSAQKNYSTEQMEKLRDQMRLPSGATLNPIPLKVVKQESRAHRNRIAAQNSRDRRKAQFSLGSSAKKIVLGFHLALDDRLLAHLQTACPVLASPTTTRSSKCFSAYSKLCLTPSPKATLHDFRHYVLDPIKMKDIGCAKTVLSAKLKSSFGYRGGPGGEEIITLFQSRGPALEEVVTVLRDHITGTGGANPLLTKWVDDLTAGRISILGNSMPEERTVSRFTRINSKDCANQDASTIVNQTKIYQHLR
ncbi:hypothetical protein B0H14DRAFT_2595674, partial [Mycena olivaceomarginata]